MPNRAARQLRVNQQQKKRKPGKRIARASRVTISESLATTLKTTNH
jgi:hypothetical protein